jgi:hypothetical protein
VPVSSQLFAQDRVIVRDCPNVHFTRCLWRTDPSPALSGASGSRVLVERSRVEFARGLCEGHAGARAGFGGTAWQMQDAVVVMIDAQISGGPGGPGYDNFPFHGGAPGGDGGTAIDLRGSSALQLWRAQAASVRGGAGGGPSPNVYPGGDGGDGIAVGASAVVLGLSPSGGAGGGPGTSPGQPFALLGGALRHEPATMGPAALFRGTPTIGSTVHFDLVAPPGDLGLLMLGFESLHFELGSQVLGDLFTLPCVATPAFVVPPSGVLSVPLFVNDLLPPGFALVGQFATLSLPASELRFSNSVLTPE